MILAGLIYTYVIFWLFSTTFLVGTITDKSIKHSYTKKEVLINLLIPFYTALKQFIKAIFN